MKGTSGMILFACHPGIITHLAYNLLGGEHGPLRLLTHAATYSLVFGIVYGLGLGLFFGLASGIAVSRCRLNSIEQLVG